MARPSFEGVIPAVVTPFSLRGAVDAPGLQRHLRWLSGRGLSNWLISGSTGESPLLNETEHRRLVGRASGLRRRGALLLAGSGAESTRGTIRLCRASAEAGADAVLVVNPSYYKGMLDEGALEAFYTEVAEASPLPVMLYSVPKFTGLPLSPALVERLAPHPNIIGLKDSSGDLAALQAFLERTPPDFQVFTGAPLIAGAAVLAGASGAILAMANVVPGLCRQLYGAARAGDVEGVRRLQTELNFLTRAIQNAHGIPGLKAAATILGGCGGYPRAPLRPLEEPARQRIAAALREAGYRPRSR
jgi:4-hydroxy-2-oxoglutarate aldolase